MSEQFSGYFIYGLEDPRDRMYHYIGKTKDLYARFRQHLANLSEDSLKGAWLNECRQANEVIVMRMIERVPPHQDPDEREKSWIQHYIYLGHPLTNQDRGSWLDGVVQLQEANTKLQQEIYELRGRFQAEKRKGEVLAAQLEEGVAARPKWERGKVDMKEVTSIVLTLREQGLGMHKIATITQIPYNQVLEVCRSYARG